LEAEKKAA